MQGNQYPGYHIPSRTGSYTQDSYTPYPQQRQQYPPRYPSTPQWPQSPQQTQPQQPWAPPPQPSPQLTPDVGPKKKPKWYEKEMVITIGAKSGYFMMGALVGSIFTYFFMLYALVK